MAIDDTAVLLFTRNGMGDAPDDLRLKLAEKFLGLINDSGNLPAKILFYTEGVKMACHGSPVLPLLKSFESQGVEMILCQTCLTYFNLEDKVEAGIVGGMPDIIDVLGKAERVISL